MYIFQLKLTNQFSNRKESFSFPHKHTKKYGTSHIDYYYPKKDGLGWFKTKRLDEAERGFIRKLKSTITHAQKESVSPNTSSYRVEEFPEWFV